jgi:hypothetical protein
MPLIIELPHCFICGEDYKNGEIMAGVRFGHTEVPAANGNGWILTEPGEYFEGHYDCIIEAMGPVRTLEAIQNSKLPPREIAMLNAALIGRNRRNRDA